MKRRYLRTGFATVLALSVLLPVACSNGSDGAPGSTGPQGPAGVNAINASTASPEVLAALDIESSISAVDIASPPVITFSVSTSTGVPIIGLVPLWEDDSRYVRFTITKLVPGQNGDPDTWVAYVRDDTSGEPDYDTGSSLVDNDDGTYTFTFNTDITAVTGVAYEPTLTHRVAGQIGSRSVPLEAQNLVFDFVPDGSEVTLTRDIATMTSCNECHTDLVFHGRRFKVEYCVQCHNPDLAQGEGDFSFMIHRIHNAGDFAVLDDAISFAHVTYPQEIVNCRKCHNAEDTATPQASNWLTQPNMKACDGCHDIFNANAAGSHPLTSPTDNSQCADCHTPADIELYHLTSDPMPNNPELPANQHVITYELISAAVDGSNNVTIEFKILSDGTALDILNLPAEFKDGGGSVFRYPGFLLAYAQPQYGITAPADWNNFGRTSGQPISVSLSNFGPTGSPGSAGTVSFDGGTGVMTAIITNPANQFPTTPTVATLRAVGLQGYLRQDLDNDGDYDSSLHAASVTIGVTGDAQRREIVDTTKCASCHDWFNAHGGNRVFTTGSDLVCTMCHVPNLSSSGRTLDLNHPEDAQNFKDLIHGIHSAGFRTRAFEHVRNFQNNARIYDWSEVTFPRGASTSNCTVCHSDTEVDDSQDPRDGLKSFELPLPANVLPTNVRTTGVAAGNDPSTTAAGDARDGANLPNLTDWVNMPTASACFYCHTSTNAWAHMWQNGGLLSVPPTTAGPWTNRSGITGSFETCTVCHGPGRIADLNIVHNK